MEDLLNQDGVKWVALIGPDALPIDFSPAEHDVEAAVAMWTGLDVLVEDTPARMMIRTSEAVMLSHRVDEDRLLLIQAESNTNLGSLRNLLQDTAGRIIDLA
jgi:predicted regulator of Ras-like GTPase activity (Roadblock/LC7/MglB family)